MSPYLGYKNVLPRILEPNLTHYSQLSFSAVQIKSVNLCSVYIPLNADFNLHQINTLFNRTLGLDFVSGDFNAKSTLQSNTQHDNSVSAIEEAILQSERKIIFNNRSYTYIGIFPSFSATDLLTCSNPIALFCNWKILLDTYGNDHLLISLNSNLQNL